MWRGLGTCGGVEATDDVAQRVSGRARWWLGWEARRRGSVGAREEEEGERKEEAEGRGQVGECPDRSPYPLFKAPRGSWGRGIVCAHDPRSPPQYTGAVTAPRISIDGHIHSGSHARAEAAVWWAQPAAISHRACGLAGPRPLLRYTWQAPGLRRMRIVMLVGHEPTGPFGSRSDWMSRLGSRQPMPVASSRPSAGKCLPARSASIAANYLL